MSFNTFNQLKRNLKQHKVCEEITYRVNSINPTVVRTVKDVQKCFKDMVKGSKKEIWKQINPATRGTTNNLRLSQWDMWPTFLPQIKSVLIFMQQLIRLV